MQSDKIDTTYKSFRGKKNPPLKAKKCRNIFRGGFQGSRWKKQPLKVFATDLFRFYKDGPFAASIRKRICKTFSSGFSDLSLKVLHF